MTEAIVVKCECKHGFQDGVYGKGMRVFNEVQTKGTNKAFRCTVCNKEIFHNIERVKK